MAALANPDENYVPGDFFAYTAPANTILQANTTYWIVLNEEQAQTDWQGWGRAASTGEDSASLPGWSIGDSRLQKRGTSWHTAADSLQIDIRGHKNADPKLGIAAASALEGSAVRFTVSLDNPTDGAVTVQYDTADDTAIAGTDYTAVSSGTLTIPAGDSVAEFSIDTTEDGVDEADETFTVTLSNPSSNADLGTDKSATGTILDGDGKPAVSAIGASATEGSNLSFTVSLRFATDADVTVQYSTSIGTDDTASVSDFTAESGETVTIVAGQTESTISIATTQDSVDESDETFTLTISNPSSNAELGTVTSATGTIEDDDTAGLAFSTPTLDVAEGASSSYTVALATKPSANVSVTIAAGGSAGLTLGNQSQLSFTPTNWDQAQTVSVSAGPRRRRLAPQRHADAHRQRRRLRIGRRRAAGCGDRRRHTRDRALRDRAAGARGRQRHLHGRARDPAHAEGDAGPYGGTVEHRPDRQRRANGRIRTRTTGTLP